MTKEMYGTELVVNGEQIDMKQFYHEEKPEEINVFHYWNKEKQVYGIGETIEEAYMNASKDNYEAFGDKLPFRAFPKKHTI